MPPRLLGLFGVATLGACFSPDPIEQDDTDNGSTSTAVATDSSGPGATDTTDSATTTPTTTTPPPGTSSDSTDDTGPDSSSDGADSSTGEPPPIECGDGIPAAGELCFDDATTFQANDVVYSPRLGDVNEDGNGDIVYLIGDQIVLHLGDGRGGFGVDIPEETLTGTDMELADLDGDGSLDVVFINRYEGYFDYARGNGAGGFVLQNLEIPTGENPVALVAQSLNGNERADIITGALSGSIRTFITDFEGVPMSSDTMSSGMEIRDIELGDFSGDGDLDIVFTSDTSNVRIRLGDGTGDFGTQVGTDSMIDDPSVLATGDFNADGDSDIAYAGNSTNAVGVLLGTGAASFAAEITLATDDVPSALTAVDLTNDGLDDIVAVYGGSMMISVFPSEPGDGFGDRVDYPIGSVADSVSFGDANNDDVPDIVTGSFATEFVTVLLSTP